VILFDIIDRVFRLEKCHRPLILKGFPIAFVLLIAENLCLRQQLLVLQRRHPQPRLRNTDRGG